MPTSVSLDSLCWELSLSWLFASPCHAEYVRLIAEHDVVELTAFWSDYAINNKLTPFISMQNHHNLLYREEEREMFPTLKVLWAQSCWQAGLNS